MWQLKQKVANAIARYLVAQLPYPLRLQPASWVYERSPAYAVAVLTGMIERLQHTYKADAGNMRTLCGQLHFISNTSDDPAAYSHRMKMRRMIKTVLLQYCSHRVPWAGLRYVTVPAMLTNYRKDVCTPRHRVALLVYWLAARFYTRAWLKATAGYRLQLTRVMLDANLHHLTVQDKRCDSDARDYA